MRSSQLVSTRPHARTWCRSSRRMQLTQTSFTTLVRPYHRAHLHLPQQELVLSKPAKQYPVCAVKVVTFLTMPVEEDSEKHSLQVRRSTSVLSCPLAQVLAH